jgi:steroid delta-isomerase
LDTSYMVETVKKYIDALNQHDISAIEDIFDSNASVEDPVGSDPRVGQKALRELYLNGFGINIKAELTGNVRCAGTCAVFPFFVILQGGDPPIKIEVIDVFEFNESGKVMSMKAYWGPDNCTPL